MALSGIRELAASPPFGDRLGSGITSVALVRQIAGGLIPALAGLLRRQARNFRP